jgi:hypothetical protein
MMEKKRSKGTTIFGWFFIFEGLLIVLGNSCMITMLTPDMPMKLKLVPFYSIPVGVLHLVCGIGILRLKEIARKTMLFVTIGTALVGIFTSYIYSEYLTVFELLAYYCKFIIILIYLTRPKVKEQFT